MIGVTLGALLLLLLIGLVVLQGLIEWGGFDFDKIIKKKAKETAETVKEIVPAAAPKKTAKKKAAPKKAAKKKAAPKKKAAKGKGKK